MLPLRKPEDVPGLDLDRSTLTFAGRPWPVVAVVCPDEGSERSVSERTLGSDLASFYIPLENGLLVNLDLSERGWEMWVNSRHCAPEPMEGYLLPLIMVVNGRVVRRIGGKCHWSRVEPEWVNEFIERLMTFEVEPQDGPTVTLQPLGPAYEAFVKVIEARRAA